MDRNDARLLKFKTGTIYIDCDRYLRPDIRHYNTRSYDPNVTIVKHLSKTTLRSIVNCFIFSSNLNVIVSEFYDLDVGTVKRIEIKPSRIRDSIDGGWNLYEVQRLYFLQKL